MCTSKRIFERGLLQINQISNKASCPLHLLSVIVRKTHLKINKCFKNNKVPKYLYEDSFITHFINGKTVRHHLTTACIKHMQSLLNICSKVTFLKPYSQRELRIKRSRKFISPKQPHQRQILILPPKIVSSNKNTWEASNQNN